MFRFVLAFLSEIESARSQYSIDFQKISRMMPKPFLRYN